MLCQVMSYPVHLSPGVQHSQFTSRHLGNSYIRVLRTLESRLHLAKLLSFLIGDRPVECECVTSRTNLIESIATTVYFVV